MNPNQEKPKPLTIESLKAAMEEGRKIGEALRKEQKRMESRHEVPKIELLCRIEALEKKVLSLEDQIKEINRSIPYK